MPPFSYILFLIFLFYVAGILSARIISVNLSSIYLLGALSLTFAFIFYKKRIFYFFLGVIFFVVGIIAGLKELENTRVLEKWRAEKRSKIRVKVSSIPERRENKVVFQGFIPDSGVRVKIYSYHNPGIYPGQTVKAEGNFRKTKRGIYFSADNIAILREDFSFTRFIYNIKIYISRAIDDLYPSRFSGFIKAITIGERENINSFRYYIQRAGLAHILAISGLHVGLILFFFYFLFKNLGVRRRARSIILIFIAIVYLFLTSGRPPVVRATIMAIIYLYFSMFYIRVNVFNLILTAGILILLLEPSAIYQASFQLSFTAVGGICLFLKLFPSRGKYTLRDKVIDYLKVVFSAWIFTSPLVWYYWRRVAVFQFPVNFFLLPVFTLILAMVFCSLFFSFIFLPLAKFFASSSYPFLYLFLGVTRFISSSNYASINLRGIGWKTVIGIYVFLVGGIYAISAIIRKNTGGVQCSE